MSEEPPAKKAKTGFESHTLNIAEGVMKADEGKHFAELATGPVSTLQGIGPVSSKVLEVLKIKTVAELADYKFFKWARALAALAETEVKGDRPEGSTMNVDKMLIKEYETKTLTEIVEAPVSALEGLTDEAGEFLKELGVKTVGDLATFKYCRWAEAIVIASEHEHTKTEAERKAEKLLKKLE